MATRREWEKEASQQWADASGYEVAIGLDRLRLTLSAWPLSQGEPQPTFQGGAPRLEVDADPASSAADEWATEDTPQRRARLAADPVLGVRKSFRPRMSWPHGATTSLGKTALLRDLLPDLARTYGVSFISDAYDWSAGSIGVDGLSTPEPVALYALLDRLASGTHRWDHHGRLVRLRSRTWYLDRVREIPLRLIRRWQSLCDQHGVLPLTEQIGLLTALSDEQWSTLDLFRATLTEEQETSSGTAFTDRMRLPAGFAGPREALQFLAALTSAQQQALWNGRALSPAQMIPVQQELFLAGLRQRQQRQIRYLFAPSRLPEANTASIFLTQDRLLLVRERRDGSIRYHTEPEPSPMASLGPSPAASIPSGADAARPLLQPEPPRPSGSIADRSRSHNASASLTRYPITRLELHFEYGSEVNETTDVTVASPLASLAQGSEHSNP